MIFKWEIKKLYGTLRYARILLLISVIAAVIQFVAINFTVKMYDSSEEIYRQYMEYLNGEISDEKTDYIFDELKSIEECIERSDKVSEEYRNGNISLEEYSDYKEEYYYAKTHEEAIKRVESTYNRIKENGGWFVYETKWKELFSTSIFSGIFACFVITLFSLYVGNEFDSGMWQYLNSSVYGREKTIVYKSFITYLSVFFGFVFYQVIRYCILYFDGELFLGNATIKSIGICENMKMNCSIIAFYFITVILQALAMASVAVITLLIAYVTKNSQVSMAIMGIIFMVPYMVKDYSSNIFMFMPTGACNLAESIEGYGISANITSRTMLYSPLLILAIGIILLFTYIRLIRKNHTD